MDYLAGASGAALGFIAGDVPGAVLGAKMGYNASKFFTKKDSMPGKRKFQGKEGQIRKKAKSKSKTMALVKKSLGKTKNRVGKSASGSYRGRFKKPAKLVKDIKAKAGKLGWQQVIEFSGTVTDPDCVYLHYNNFNKDEIFKTITGAVVRTLFREAKIDISNQEQELPLNLPNQSQFSASNAIVITFVAQDPITHAQSHVDFFIPDNATLRSVIVGVYTTAGHLGQFMNGYIGNSVFGSPYMIIMYRDVSGLGRIPMASLTFENLMLEFEMNATLTCQNSSLGSGASTDPSADRVDNQPLKGSLFHFSHADPRLKQTMSIGTGVLSNNDWVLSSGVQKGINVWGSAVMPYTIDNEPPSARIWKNIKKSSGVQLDPGIIKKTVLSNKYKNYFAELLKRFRGDVFGSLQGLEIFNNVKACQSQILVLEERIRTPSTNQISVNWEYENRNYCIAYQKKSSDTNVRGSYTGSALAQWVPA